MVLPALLAGAVGVPAAHAGELASGDARATSAVLKAKASAPARYRGGQVVVRDRSGSRVVRVRDVSRAVRTLSKRTGVLSVTPNYIARSTGWIPPDPGRGREVGGWQKLQWNFLPATGVNAPEAWAEMSCEP